MKNKITELYRSRTLNKELLPNGKFVYTIKKTLNLNILENKDNYTSVNNDYKHIDISRKYHEILKKDLNAGLVERVELVYKSKYSKKEWTHNIWQDKEPVDIFEETLRGKKDYSLRIKVPNVKKESLLQEFKRNVAMEIESSQINILSKFSKVTMVDQKDIGRGDITLLIPTYDKNGEMVHIEYLVSLKKTKKDVRVVNMGSTTKTFERFMTQSGADDIGAVLESLKKESIDKNGDFKGFQDVLEDFFEGFKDGFNNLEDRDKEYFIYRMLNLSKEQDTYEFYGDKNNIIIGYQKYKSIDQIREEQKMGFGLVMRNITLLPEYNVTKTSIGFKLQFAVGSEIVNVGFRLREKSGGKDNRFGIEVSVREVSELSKYVILDKAEGSVEDLVEKIKNENNPPKRFSVKKSGPNMKETV